MKPYRDDRPNPQDTEVPVLDLSCAYSSVDDLLSDLNGESAEMQGKVQEKKQSN